MILSNESSDHFHEDGKLVPSLQCGFCFEAEFQLLNLNLSRSVYLRSATSRQYLSFVPIFLHGIVDL